VEQSGRSGGGGAVRAGGRAARAERRRWSGQGRRPSGQGRVAEVELSPSVQMNPPPRPLAPRAATPVSSSIPVDTLRSNQRRGMEEGWGELTPAGTGWGLAGVETTKNGGGTKWGRTSSPFSVICWRH
jgi:hypothetical protein